MLKRFCFTLIALIAIALTAQSASRRFTLVIDAGHGGHDHGAPGAFSKEKDLTLKYALALGKMIEQRCPDVKVVYTRKTDVFIPLIKRAKIANDNKADLFLSVHINALERNHTARGFQSYTLGRGANSGDRGIRENLEVAKRENSVIYLEKDYQNTYKGFDPNSAESDIMFEFIADKNRERSVELSRLMQQEVCRATGRNDAGSHQNNLAVLRLTSMPATLLELGFISTPEEEQFLNSDAALDLYTKGMYNAFIRYKNKYDDNITVPYRDDNGARTADLIAVEPPMPTQAAPATSASTQPQPQAKADNDTRRTPTRKPADRKTPTPVAKPAPATAKVDASKPVFKIQIFATSSTLKAGDRNFKGLEGCEYYEEGSHKKYTYGASNNYNEIYRLQKQVVEKFPECFIIAFKDGKRVNVNEAIREFKANR